MRKLTYFFALSIGMIFSTSCQKEEVPAPEKEYVDVLMYWTDHSPLPGDSVLNYPTFKGQYLPWAKEIFYLKDGEIIREMIKGSHQIKIRCEVLTDDKDRKYIKVGMGYYSEERAFNGARLPLRTSFGYIIQNYTHVEDDQSTSVCKNSTYPILFKDIYLYE